MRSASRADGRGCAAEAASVARDQRSLTAGRVHKLDLGVLGSHGTRQAGLRSSGTNDPNGPSLAKALQTYPVVGTTKHSGADVIATEHGGPVDRVDMGAGHPRPVMQRQRASGY